MACKDVSSSVDNDTYKDLEVQVSASCSYFIILKCVNDS